MFYLRQAASDWAVQGGSSHSSMGKGPPLTAAAGGRGQSQGSAGAGLSCSSLQGEKLAAAIGGRVR